MAIVAEKRLYETPDGELVEELEDFGSLFCGVGAELEGVAAKRYQAYEAKAMKPAEDKAMEPVEDKAEPQTKRGRKSR